MNTSTTGKPGPRPNLGLFVLALVLSLAGGLLWPCPARSGWIIDRARLHLSAHGELGCLDCHDQVAARDVHPDPAQVSKSLRDFFEPDHCFVCHDQVLSDLEAGRHGQRAGVDPARYENCLLCHNPHHQARRTNGQTGRFEPTRPRSQQCGACHEERSALPEPSEEDKACLGCHGLKDRPPEERALLAKKMCLSCHARPEAAAAGMPLLDRADYAASPHAGLDCLTCHPAAARFRHDRQHPGECLGCHSPHDDKVAHDAHLAVACQACHLPGAEPVRDESTRRIVWRLEKQGDAPSRVHRMALEDGQESCRRCHAPGNPVGAPALVLPAKSLICLPCHAATLSVGDTTTVVALLIFLAGLVLAASVWLSGSLPGREEAGPGAKLAWALGAALRAVFSRRIAAMLQAVFLDVLLQRGLYRRSRPRWLIHALIFWPFVIRFSWGLLALLGSLWAPGSSWPWLLLDKNGPAAAFVFDLTGLTVLLGVGLALARRFMSELTGRPEHLPPQDRPALALLGGIIVIGFVLEGMRMAMTLAPGGANRALLGHLISLAFRDSTWLTGAYGYLWYAHAVLTGAFVAYLPFSRMFHILMSPLAAALRAAATHEPAAQRPRQVKGA